MQVWPAASPFCACAYDLAVCGMGQGSAGLVKPTVPMQVAANVVSDNTIVPSNVPELAPSSAIPAKSPTSSAVPASLAKPAVAPPLLSSAAGNGPSMHRSHPIGVGVAASSANNIHTDASGSGWVASSSSGCPSNVEKWGEGGCCTTAVGQQSHFARGEPATPDRAAGGVVSDRLYVCGSLDDGGRALSSTEVFSSQTQTWEALPPASERRAWPAASTAGAELNACGGRDGHRPLQSTECLDPVSEVQQAQRLRQELAAKKIAIEAHSRDKADRLRLIESLEREAFHKEEELVRVRASVAALEATRTQVYTLYMKLHERDVMIDKMSRYKRANGVATLHEKDKEAFNMSDATLCRTSLTSGRQLEEIYLAESGVVALEAIEQDAQESRAKSDRQRDQQSRP